MAIVNSKSNMLTQQYKKYKKRALYWGIGWIASFILFLPLHGITAITFIICFILMARQLSKVSTLKSGINGEQQTLDLLNTLPDTYTVFTNVIMEFENKKSEIDAVLAGPNGIWVIETKNHNGEIVGSDKDQNWIQHKVGRRGGQYSKTFYNPTKQVGTHVYRISSVLKQHGIHKWVQGVVYFTNPEANLRINVTGAIPVFNFYGSRGKDLLNYVQSNNHDQLSSSELEKIKKILMTA